jgi:peroxiredoxin
VEKLERFGTSCNAPYGLGSDSTRAMRKLYDVERRFGLGTSRVTYVIDVHGIIRAVFHNEFSMSSHVRNALRALDKLR